MNSAYDSWGTAGYKSATGSFHSLGFKVGKTSQSAEWVGTRAQAITTLAGLFEELDQTEPLSTPKKAFFHKAAQTFGGTMKDAWLKAAWSKAKLNPVRRQAGLKSN
jgi:hypothetical protein